MSDTNDFEPPAQADFAPPAPPADPPAPPPLPPAGGGGDGGSTGNPWEQRDRLGMGQALIENLKLFITSPTEAFRRTRENGDFASPLLFAVIVGWVGAIIGQIWSLVFQSSILSFLPGEYQDQIGSYLAGGVTGFIITMVMAPLYILVALFIWSAILHVSALVVGALTDSHAGFEGTFRVVAYSSVAQVANFIPIVGGLIAFAWSIALGTIGIAQIHRTSTGKGLAAMLIPIILCCLCVMVGAIVFGASMAALISSQG